MAAGLAFAGLDTVEIRAELSPEWVSRVPVGTSLTSGPAGIYVDPDGVSYITGISGPSSNTDITTVSFAPDGSTRWSKTFNSGGMNADQVRGITKSAGGIVYVVGNTPGPGSFANVLILGYDANTGALLKTIKFSSGPGLSEFGRFSERRRLTQRSRTKLLRIYGWGRWSCPLWASFSPQYLLWSKTRFSDRLLKRSRENRSCSIWRYGTALTCRLR